LSILSNLEQGAFKAAHICCLLRFLNGLLTCLHFRVIAGMVFVFISSVLCGLHRFSYVLSTLKRYFHLRTCCVNHFNCDGFSTSRQYFHLNSNDCSSASDLDPAAQALGTRKVRCNHPGVSCPVVWTRKQASLFKEKHFRIQTRSTNK